MELLKRLSEVSHNAQGQCIDTLNELYQSSEAVSLLSTELELVILDFEKLKNRIETIKEKAKEAKSIRNHESDTLKLIRMNVIQTLNDTEILSSELPYLKKHVQAVELLVSGSLSSDEDRRRVCLELRLGFEEMLNLLLFHFGCPVTEGMPLGDRVLFLKPYMNPPVRLNSFFDIKEYSSLGVHKAIMGSDIVPLRAVEKMVVAFRGVLEETRIAIRNKSEVKKQENARTANVAGVGKYKTVMCRNWKKYSSCPHGDRCLFAHGDEELKSAQAAIEQQ